VDFDIGDEHRKLQQRARVLAADFATRSAVHDRAASHPSENYARLRDAGFLELTVPEKFGGDGVDFLGHILAFEALGAGCPATALAFNMHASVVMPVMDSAEIAADAKQRLADLVVRQKKLIGGNFSEPGTTSLVGLRPLTARARRIDGGYSVTGRKMFASMIEAADCCMVGAYPDDATSPHAGIVLLIPRGGVGRHVEANWDTLGMRATRSDSLILEDCRVPDEAVILRTDDIRPFRTDHANWFWGSYTAVYLGLAQAAYDEAIRVLSTRQPQGYAQPLSYHPDVRRHVAAMSIELEAARLLTYRAAWQHDREGPTPAAVNALYQAKYAVGEACSHITRTALTLGGAHAIFTGTRLEQLFRDGALAPIQPPQSDFCLQTIGLHALGLDPDEVLPPLKPL
jgi:alkylation response protein AidB-like acyl-CoA dehydrogenase